MNDDERLARRPGRLNQVVAERHVGEAEDAAVVREDERVAAERSECGRWRAAPGTPLASSTRPVIVARASSGSPRSRSARAGRRLGRPATARDRIAGLDAARPAGHAFEAEESVGVGLRRARGRRRRARPPAARRCALKTTPSTAPVASSTMLTDVVSRGWILSAHDAELSASRVERDDVVALGGKRPGERERAGRVGGRPIDRFEPAGVATVAAHEDREPGAGRRAVAQEHASDEVSALVGSARVSTMSNVDGPSAAAENAGRLAKRRRSCRRRSA